MNEKTEQGELLSTGDNIRVILRDSTDGSFVELSIDPSIKTEEQMKNMVHLARELLNAGRVGNERT